MQRIDISRSLAERLHYSVSKPIFQMENIARGHGWKATEDRLNNPKETTDLQINSLISYIKSHIIGGNKLCKFYKIDPTTLSSLKKDVQSLNLEKNSLSKFYPLIVPEKELSKYPLSIPKLIKIENYDNGCALVYSSVRITTKRDKFPSTALQTHVLPSGTVYKEVVGIREKRHQSFSIVWIPTNGDIIEIRSDHIDGSSIESTETEINLTLSEINKSLKLTIQNKPINLFPLINLMYSAPNEGKVVELSFGTTTRSLKTEKMRNSHECLREELFHKGGEQNLSQPIRPYRLSISYDVQLKKDEFSHPEISIHSTSHESECPAPKHASVLIQKNIGKEDYEFARDRIIKYV